MGVREWEGECGREWEGECGREWEGECGREWEGSVGERESILVTLALGPTRDKQPNLFVSYQLLHFSLCTVNVKVDFIDPPCKQLSTFRAPLKTSTHPPKVILEFLQLVLQKGFFMQLT